MGLTTRLMWELDRCDCCEMFEEVVRVRRPGVWGTFLACQTCLRGPVAHELGDACVLLMGGGSRSVRSFKAASVEPSTLGRLVSWAAAR